MSGLPMFYFEPNDELFAELSSNISRNKLQGVVGSQSAVGRFSGRGSFYLNLTDNLRSSLVREFGDNDSVKSVGVDVVTFDDFVQERKLDGLCVKVDVENAEFEFLEGAQANSVCISFLIMEVLGPAISRDFVTTAMQQFGMHAYYINDFNLEHSPDGRFRYISPQYNWLFCRESPDQLRRILESSRFAVVN